ncbi:two-component system response regulator YesN [Paenibacillus rhizosphaerae]|uniref:Two-component system response regulator YesN n=1 Tax=Paenibacillus rhizosphaerae TaxID=297318 RepID=A0A839TFU0_9BACL|nr:response regulator [Paenibacillus rhizosphaerae]MBB3125472.1 two-component system response regulator YesN [Paenibacillus rhizosphaerae]
MYKMVIIDDEPTVRSGLSDYLDWSAYGIELSGTADDGDTGLELIERVKPDIVLTDVMMPTMDGISMSREIGERLPETKIVFISGHSDADFLRSALQIHAADYIFKPVKRKELQKVIERVMQDLQTKEKERQLLMDMQVKLMQSMPLLREKFLMSLLRDVVGKPEGLREKLAFLNLELPLESPYLVLVFTIDDSEEVLGGRSEQDKQLLSYSILNVIQELIDHYLKGYAFENRTAEYVGLIFLDDLAEDSEASLLLLAEAIRDNLRLWLKISVTIGIGERADSISGLPASYRHAREAADQKWYLGKNQVITMDSLEIGEPGSNRFDSEQSDRLLSGLKSGDRGRLEMELESLFEPLKQIRKNGFKYARHVGLQLISLAGRVLLDLNLLTREREEREEWALDRLLKLETMVELRSFVTKYLYDICSCIQEKRSSSRSSNVIERIQKFINEHFARNLSLAEISASVYLSQTYASLLFKQETDETIYEYLMRVRIEKAKELLRDPRVKFYEVCELVGYTDPSYFSKLFKKITGLTPSAYRDQQY